MALEFYVRVFDDPLEADYLQPAALFRWDRGDDGIPRRMQRWAKQEWVSAPGMIVLTGIGGDNDFERISETEARRILLRVGGSVEQLTED